MGWAALIPLAVSAFSAIQGASNKKKAEAERLRLANSRPELQDSEYLEDAYDLAGAELSRGGNTPGMVAMRRASDANFSSSLQSILQAGGSPGNVADLYGQAGMGELRTAMAQDDIRRSRIGGLLNAAQLMEQFRQNQFKTNEFAPFADASQATAAQLQAANNQMWNGISSAGAGLTNWGGTMEGNNAWSSYFGGGRNGGGFGGNLGNNYGSASTWGVQ